MGAVALSAALLLAACRMQQSEDEVWFDLQADPSLTAYPRVTVSLLDSLGNFRATLFDDSLSSPEKLRRISAGPYRGGPARIVIEGWRDGRPAYRETRVYDGETQTVLAVDIVLWPPEQDAAAAAPRPPVLEALRPDTVVSIGDYVAFWADAADPDGDLRGYAMDCDGDGVPEDTGSLSGGRAPVRVRRLFPDSGSYACRLEVRDVGGRLGAGRMRVRVELDPPVADAGRDTTVEVGGLIRLHARGEDRFDPIKTREWKVGDGPFVHVTQQETVQKAPAVAGELTYVLRVVDTDNLAGLDTLKVTVIERTSPP